MKRERRRRAIVLDASIAEYRKARVRRMEQMEIAIALVRHILVTTRDICNDVGDTNSKLCRIHAFVCDALREVDRRDD